MKDSGIQSLMEKYTLVNIVNKILIANSVAKSPQIDVRCIKFLDVFTNSLIVSVEVHRFIYAIKFITKIYLEKLG